MLLGRRGGHQGFAVRKLRDGSIVESATVDVPEFESYVAACTFAATPEGIHWYGLTEFPPTEQGEKAAIDEWENLHARHLLTATQRTRVSAEITAVLQWLDALTVESPVAMLSELARVSQHTSELTAIAVRHARNLGMGWHAIARALGIDEAAARETYEGHAEDGR